MLLQKNTTTTPKLVIPTSLFSSILLFILSFLKFVPATINKTEKKTNLKEEGLVLNPQLGGELHHFTDRKSVV